jgi:hypothetical protein
VVCYRAADHRARDVIEERREDQDEHEQEKGSSPIVRQGVRQRERDVTLLEVLFLLSY